MTTVYTTPSSIMLSILPAPGSPEVTHYIVYLAGNASTDLPSYVVKAKTGKMEYELTGLAEENDYVVAVKACATWNGADVCGESIAISATTTLSSVFFIIRQYISFCERLEDVIMT